MIFASLMHPTHKSVRSSLHRKGCNTPEHWQNGLNSLRSAPFVPLHSVPRRESEGSPFESPMKRQQCPKHIAYRRDKMRRGWLWYERQASQNDHPLVPVSHFLYAVNDHRLHLFDHFTLIDSQCQRLAVRGRQQRAGDVCSVNSRAVA